MDLNSRPGLPLGIGAPPLDGGELARRLRESLRAGFDGFTVALGDGALTAEVVGFDIPTLDLDLTGATITRTAATAEQGAEGGGGGLEPAPAVTVGRGVLGRARVVGDPILFEGAPVTIDADLESVAIRWARRADDVLELSDDTDDGASAATRGRVRIAVAADAIPALVEGATSSLAGGEARVRDVELAFADAGADAVGFAGTAHVGFAALSARVTVSGVVRILDGSRLRIDDLDLRSRNILAAAALAALRTRIAEAGRAEVDLISEVPGLPRDARFGISSRDGGLELTAEVEGAPTGGI